MLLNRFKKLPTFLLRPIPLKILQPAINRAVSKVIEKNPQIFDRLATNGNKSILINPTNLPMVFLFKPNHLNPSVYAYRNENGLSYDASISGSVLTLLSMIDGELDGDALFFTRDIVINGDTEAIVALRNAFDDVDGSIANDIAQIFGRIGKKSLYLLRKIKRQEQKYGY